MPRNGLFCIYKCLDGVLRGLEIENKGLVNIKIGMRSFTARPDMLERVPFLLRHLLWGGVYQRVSTGDIYDVMRCFGDIRNVGINNAWLERE